MKNIYTEPFDNETRNVQMNKSFNQNDDYNIDNHPVTVEMANEYYDFIEGKRRYLSYKDTLTMGQLEKLRLLYEFKKDEELYYQNIEQEQEAPAEKKFKQDQVFKPHPMLPVKVINKQKKPRTTKWARTRRYGTLQLKIRELN